MYTEFFLWYAVIGVFVTLIFLFRAARLVKWKVFTHFIVPLLFLCVMLAWFTYEVPIEWAQRLGVFIISFTLAVIIYDLLSALWGRIRNIFSGDKVSRTTPAYVRELCRAITVLAKRNLGGLVVVEKGDDLDQFIGGGIPFDGQVKAEVIVALFEKSSSIHDGAMIIRDGRIAKVKVILPNSLNTSIPLHMGMRHRSAIGITERSDAMALVASEERGEFGVAYRGRFVIPESHRELLETVSRALRTRKARL